MNAMLAGRLWLGTPWALLLALAAFAWRELRRPALVAWALVAASVLGYGLYWYDGACFGARFWHVAPGSRRHPDRARRGKGAEERRLRPVARAPAPPADGVAARRRVARAAPLLGSGRSLRPPGGGLEARRGPGPGRLSGRDPGDPPAPDDRPGPPGRDAPLACRLVPGPGPGPLRGVPAGARRRGRSRVPAATGLDLRDGCGSERGPPPSHPAAPTGRSGSSRTCLCRSRCP